MVFIINWTVGLLKTNLKSWYGRETPDLKSFTTVEIPDGYTPPPGIQVVASMLIILGNNRVKTSSSTKAFMGKVTGKLSF